MDNLVTLQKIELEKAIFMTKVFAWLAFSLCTTGYSALNFSRNYVLTNALRDNAIAIIVILIVELGIVFWLTMNFKTFSTLQIAIFLLLYSIINDMTIPMIFQYITGDIQISVFFMMGGMFLIMSILSYITKQEFTSWGGLIVMAFIGMGLDFALNMFWRTDNTQLIIGGIGVLVFVGLVAYKFNSDNVSNEHEEPLTKAFAIYINLFYLFISVVMEANKGNRRNAGN